MRVLSLQGDLVDSYNPAAEAPLLGLRRALLHVQYREAGAGAAGGARALLGRGKADPAAHPRVEALRRCGRAAGAVLVRGKARRQLMAAGESPKVGPAQYCGLRQGHQDPRAAGGARGAAEVRGAGGVQGPTPGRLGHEIFQKLLKAKRKVPGSRSKTLRESTQPTSLESRVAPGVMHVGVDCRRNRGLGISVRSHVDAATLRRALERMPVARSTEVVYSVRSSSSELDGAGADFS